jgi:hypothetical protein
MAKTCYCFKLSLPKRKKGKGNTIMDIDEYNASLEQNEQSEQETVTDENQDFDLLDFDDNDDTNEIEDDDNDDDNDESTSLETQTDEEPEESEPEKEVEEEPKPEKKTQTPEENAKFAEMRRQQQMEQQIQERVQQTPEYQIAKMLADRYGKTPDQMLNELRESALAEQAEKQGVPIEVLKRQQESERQQQELRQEIDRMKFESWKNRVDREKQSIKNEFPMLSDDDLQKSVEHMLTVIRNPEIPLEEAVYAVHGRKIAQALKEQAEQDALAKISGRTPSPLKPQGGKPNPTTTLTAEEKYVAKQMGILEKDYLKYKRSN